MKNKTLRRLYQVHYSVSFGVTGTGLIPLPVAFCNTKLGVVDTMDKNVLHGRLGGISMIRETYLLSVKPSDVLLVDGELFSKMVEKAEVIVRIRKTPAGERVTILQYAGILRMNEYYWMLLDVTPSLPSLNKERVELIVKEAILAGDRVVLCDNMHDLAAVIDEIY